MIHPWVAVVAEPHNYVARACPTPKLAAKWWRDVKMMMEKTNLTYDAIDQ